MLKLIAVLYLCAVLPLFAKEPVTTRYVPHLPINQNWTGYLVVANPTLTALDLVLSPRDALGEQPEIRYRVDDLEAVTGTEILTRLLPGQVRRISFEEILGDARNLSFVVEGSDGEDIESLEITATFSLVMDNRVVTTVAAPAPATIHAGYRFSNFAAPEKLTGIPQKTAFAAVNPHPYPIELTIRLYDGETSGREDAAAVLRKRIGPGQKYFDVLDRLSESTVDASKMLSSGLGCFEFEARTVFDSPAEFLLLPLGLTGDLAHFIPASPYRPDRMDNGLGGALSSHKSETMVLAKTPLRARNVPEEELDVWKSNLLIHNPTDREIAFEISFFNDSGEPQVVWVVHNDYRKPNFLPSSKVQAMPMSLGPGQTRYVLLHQALIPDRDDPAGVAQGNADLVTDWDTRDVSVFLKTPDGEPNDLIVTATMSQYYLSNLVSSRFIHATMGMSVSHWDDMSPLNALPMLFERDPEGRPKHKVTASLFNPYDEPVKIQTTLYDHLNRVVSRNLDYGPIPPGIIGKMGIGIPAKTRQNIVLDEAFFGLAEGELQTALPLGLGRVEFEATVFDRITPVKLGVVAEAAELDEDGNPTGKSHLLPFFVNRNPAPLEPEYYQDGRVVRWNPFTLIGSSENFTTGIAVLDSGKTQGWGMSNDLLAYPNDPKNPYPDNFAPKDSALGLDFREIVGGAFHVCGILEHDEGSEDVVCWGSNFFKQLIGHGRADGKPEVNIREVTPVDLGGRKPLQLALTQTESCVLTTKADGSAPGEEVWCWGLNAEQWSDGARENKILSTNLGSRVYKVDFEGKPGKVVQLTAYGNAACALFEDGRAQCWGQSNNSHLGHQYGFFAAQPPTYLEQGADRYSHIALGMRNMCAVLRTDDPEDPANGSVKCWGSNNQGVLGHTPVDPNKWAPKDMPRVDLGGKKALMTAVVNDTACVLLEDHNVHCWGSNESRALSYGELLPVLGLPLAHMVEEPFAAAVQLPNRAIYLTGAYKTFCVVDENLDVKCWGDNQRGIQGWTCLVTVFGLKCRGIPNFMREGQESGAPIVYDTHYIGGEWVMEHLPPVALDGKVRPPDVQPPAKPEPPEVEENP